MPGISRKSADSAGGVISEGSSDVFVENNGVAREGDIVVTHGKAPHVMPTLVGKSSDVFVNGKGVVRAGDPATCGHAATGSSTVNAN